MQNLKHFLFLFLLLALVVSCNNQSSEGTTSATGSNEDDGVVDIEKFETLMKSDYLLIDVRTPEEFVEGYISNAQNIDFYAEDFESQILKLKKDKPLLIYCRSGGRSGDTYTLLKANNFVKVYDLEGGFMAWQAANKPFSK